MGVSVVILTLNEEKNLPGCLESVKWSNEVIVFDSFSSDQTTQIATSYGAQVIQRAFDNYAAQRNAALDEPFYKNPWVLMLDADERVPDELATELRLVTEGTESDFTLYRIRRKDMFLGKWLRRSSGYPTWFGRLIRIGRVRVEREINEEYHTDGKVGFLKEHLIHYPFNRGISYWFERHNRYSSMEAEVLFSETQSTRSRQGHLGSVSGACSGMESGAVALWLVPGDDVADRRVPRFGPAASHHHHGMSGPCDRGG